MRIIAFIGRINDEWTGPSWIASFFCYNASALCAGSPRLLYGRTGPCLNLSTPVAVNEVRSRLLRLFVSSGFVSVSTKFDAHVLPSQALRA
jgi:hypothetical protein